MDSNTGLIIGISLLGCILCIVVICVTVIIIILIYKKRVRKSNHYDLRYGCHTYHIHSFNYYYYIIYSPDSDQTKKSAAYGVVEHDKKW